MNNILVMIFEQGELTSQVLDKINTVYKEGYRLIRDYDNSDENHNLFFGKDNITMSDNDMVDIIEIMWGISDTPFKGNDEYTLTGGTYQIEWL